MNSSRNNFSPAPRPEATQDSQRAQQASNLVPSLRLDSLLQNQNSTAAVVTQSQERVNSHQDQSGSSNTQQLVLSQSRNLISFSNPAEAANADQQIENSSSNTALILQEHPSVDQVVPAQTSQETNTAQQTTSLENIQNVLQQNQQINRISRQSSSLTGGSFSRNVVGLGQNSSMPPTVDLGQRPSQSAFFDEEVKLEPFPAVRGGVSSLNPVAQQQTFSRSIHANTTTHATQNNVQNPNSARAEGNLQFDSDFAAMMQGGPSSNNQGPAMVPTLRRTTSNIQPIAPLRPFDGLTRSNTINDLDQRARPQRLTSGIALSQNHFFNRNDNLSARSPISVGGQSFRSGIRPPPVDDLLDDDDNDDVGAESVASLQLTSQVNEPLLSPSPSRPGTRRIPPINGFRFPFERAQTPRTTQRPNMPRMEVRQGFLNNDLNPLRSAGQSPMSNSRPNINVLIPNFVPQASPHVAAVPSQLQNRDSLLPDAAPPIINIESHPRGPIQDDILDSPPPVPENQVQPPSFSARVINAIRSPRLDQRRLGVLIPSTTVSSDPTLLTFDPPIPPTNATAAAPASTTVPSTAQSSRPVATEMSRRLDRITSVQRLHFQMNRIQRAAERLIRPGIVRRRQAAIDAGRMEMASAFQQFQDPILRRAQSNVRRTLTRVGTTIANRLNMPPIANAVESIGDSLNELEEVSEGSSKEEVSDSHSSSYLDSEESPQHFYESEWSEADQLMKQDEESFPDLTEIAAAQKVQQNKAFHNQVLDQFGSIGLIIMARAQGIRFDRQKLFGSQNATMKRFSAGMQIGEITKEIIKAINLSFNIEERLNKHAQGSKLSYASLMMMDNLLPVDSNKMLILVGDKYKIVTSEAQIKEIASIKLVFDFRIAMYRFCGDQKKMLKNLNYAKSLHEMLDRSTIDHVNDLIEEWVKPINVPEQYKVPVFRCRKSYITHYRKEIDSCENEILKTKKSNVCQGSKKSKKMQSNSLFTQL